jgi:AcrR family transcriptional regulator
LVRGKAREEAILSSTIALLGELGYDAITMDAVAARAHASKATMYRRWRNKAELVKAALDALDAKDNSLIPDTGALRSDLVAVMRAARDKATAPYMAMILDLVVAARRDPALAASLRAHIEDEELSPFRVVLQRAVQRRALPAGAPTELVHEVAEAMISRQLQAGSPFDDTFILRVVDDVLLPLLGKKRRRE